MNKQSKSRMFRAPKHPPEPREPLHFKCEEPRNVENRTCRLWNPVHRCEASQQTATRRRILGEETIRRRSSCLAGAIILIPISSALCDSHARSAQGDQRFHFTLPVSLFAALSLGKTHPCVCLHASQTTKRDTPTQMLPGKAL